MLQVADLLGMVRTEDLARTVPTNSSQPPSLWPMQWSASLWLLSFNKAFSIIIHSVFVKLGNVSYGQDFTLEAILFLMLELDSHRYGAGASLWPKKWTHEQQLSQKTTFSPIVIFSIPFLGILPTRSGYFALTAKNSKFSHQLSSEVTSCHHLSIIIITSYQVSSSIIDQPIWTCFIEHVFAPDVTKIPMIPWKTRRSPIKILFEMFKSQLLRHR